MLLSAALCLAAVLAGTTGRFLPDLRHVHLHDRHLLANQGLFADIYRRILEAMESDRDPLVVDRRYLAAEALDSKSLARIARKLMDRLPPGHVVGSS